MSIFFTSDTHFGHDRIIELAKRPFKCSEEMDEKLIENWNGVVKPSDTIYHLGDFGCGEKATAEYLKSIHDRLNGNITYIKGNHDKPKRLSLLPPFQGTLEVKIGKKLFVLGHFPQLTWTDATHGSYHVFGHVHQLMKGIGKSIYIGVEAWNYTPVSVEQVNEILNTLEITQPI